MVGLFVLQNKCNTNISIQLFSKTVLLIPIPNIKQSKLIYIFGVVNLTGVRQVADTA
jgi:hypothetical protein